MNAEFEKPPLPAAGEVDGVVDALAAFDEPPHAANTSGATKARAQNGRSRVFILSLDHSKLCLRSAQVVLRL